MGSIIATASFSPWTALIGGVCIGILSSGKTLITGRILGISGAIKCDSVNVVGKLLIFR